jgi:hypothetical protein
MAILLCFLHQRVRAMGTLVFPKCHVLVSQSESEQTAENAFLVLLLLHHTLETHMGRVIVQLEPVYSHLVALIAPLVRKSLHLLQLSQEVYRLV